MSVIRDDSAARKKFESFTFGKVNTQRNSHGHSRSHSRNASISSTSSLPFSVSSKSTNSFDGASFSNPAPSSKHNSHHRRRSSVSTRRESAEIMGVSLPDLPPSTSDDNINFGDKDSIRRRALWALEGKSDVPYSKVEIPELSTPVMEKLMSDLSSKPSASTPTYGQSLSTLMANKRDSFKLLAPSSSSKDQLHTLVEEEEEDDDLQSKPHESLMESPETPLAITPALAIVKAPTSRHRPANLSLRPLSLTPENLVTAVNGLPTPSLTPTPRPGLKSLALTPSSSIMDDSMSNINILTKPSISPSYPRPSLNVSIPATESPSIPVTSTEKSTRRSSIRYKSSSTSSTSSNGMSTTFAGLPTPEMTPTSFDRRYSISDSIRNRRSSIGTTSSGDDEFFPAHPSQGKSLSASEQHFLFKSHNALLARITDLERALSMRRRDSSGFSNVECSRPVSMASDFSPSEAGSEPSDEMLRLVADLKAERDELKRDVDGWRTRVGDMEKQLGIFTKRVETERRDAWVARSMVGLLEIEKSTLERKLDSVEKMMADMEDEKRALVEVNEAAQKKLSAVEEELEVVKQELEEEKMARQEAVVPVFEADTLTTPTPNTFQLRSRPHGFRLKKGLGFTSLDSEGSTTDVDDSFEENVYTFPLKAVAEEPEELLSEEESGLAGYEDEEDSDLSFRSSSSFDSDDDAPRSVAHLEIDFSSSVAPSSGSGSGTPIIFSRSTSPALDISSRPMHISRASLSRTWTFPKGIQASTVKPNNDAEVDRFFGCLDDGDTESSFGSTPASPTSYSYEKHKGLFASGFKYGTEDEDGPFFLPDGVGVEINEERKATGEEEEDEDDATTQVDEDENMFGEVGGITITFTPPEADDVSFDIQRSSSPVKKSVATLNFLEEEEEEAVPFNFGRPIVAQHVDIPKVIVSAPPPSSLITPPSSLPRLTTSSIPRATTVKSSSSPTEITTSTPPRSMPSASPSNFASNPFITPPTRRGGTMPSFIPQAISSPSPIRPASISGRTKITANSTFIRQPQRKPLMATNNTAGNLDTSVGANVNSAMNTRSVRRSSEVSTAPSTARPPSEMKSVDLSDYHNPRTPSTTIREYPVPDRDISRSRSASAVPAGSSSSSSFSSIMSSPLSARISFQTFTNFIPVAWSPRNQITEPVASLSLVTPGSNSSVVSSERVPESRPLFYSGAQTRVPVNVPRKRGYVSKEKQLAKLRNWLEHDGGAKMRTSVSIFCKKCDDKEVFL